MEQVFRTLSCVDTVNHAKRVEVPGLFSVALLDDITSASTVFAAFNHFAANKRISVYPFSGHEGGGTAQRYHKLDFVSSAISSAR